MSMPNIIALRQLLRDKFPGLRTRADELPDRLHACWPSGLTHLDQRLGGGFAKGALSEIISPHRTSGSAVLLSHLIEQVAATRQFVGLIDADDSFDPAGINCEAANRLLWMRCHNAEEALKAGDLILRDGNLPVVVIDLALSSDAQLRKVAAPTWYRFQRIVEERGVTCLIFTPRAMISPAQTRITLETHFGLNALSRDKAELVNELEFVVSEARHGALDEPLRRTA
jgi:hypothetical protein